MVLSETTQKMLSAAAQRSDRLITFPPKLPAAARNAVIRSLLKQDLVTEVATSAEQRSMAWRQDEDGYWMIVRISDAGLQVVALALPTVSARHNVSGNGSVHLPSALGNAQSVISLRPRMNFRPQCEPRPCGRNP